VEVLLRLAAQKERKAEKAIEVTANCTILAHKTNYTRHATFCKCFFLFFSAANKEQTSGSRPRMQDNLWNFSSTFGVPESPYFFRADASPFDPA